MPLDTRFLRSAIALGLTACAAAGTASAQSTTITFTNPEPDVVIPLLTGTAVNIDGQGNLTAQCQLATGGGCIGAAAPSGNKADITSFLRSDTNEEVTAGESISLSWASTSAVVCQASSNPSVGGWSGVQPAIGTAVPVVLSAQGAYALSLTCFNNDGSTGAKSVNVDVGAAVGPGTGTEDCTGISGDLVKPAGFTQHFKTWPQAFYNYQYPLSGGPLAPVGSFTMRSEFPSTGPAIAGRYITIPFTPDGQGTHKLEWALAQPIGSPINYNPARGADRVFVTLSTCMGDFRLENNQSSDPLLWDDCRKSLQQGAIYYAANGSNNVCQLTTGKTYFVNILFADPTDGLTTTEHTCGGANTRCEANFKHN